jgi:hypothetical protein
MFSGLTLSSCQSIEATRASVSTALGTGQTFSWYGYEGRWAGNVVPSTAHCGGITQGSMAIGHDQFSFDPFGGTTMIDGTLAPDGTLAGSYQRQIGGGANGTASGLSASTGKPKSGDTAVPAAAAGHKTVSISLRATASTAADDSQQITGTLESGPCRWQVTLHRG